MTIGVDIGGTKCAVACLDADARVHECHRFATRGPEDTLEELSRAVSAALANDRTPPTIGISVGTLRAADGLISGAPNLPGWNDVPVVDFFRSRFGASVHLMNDAKACAVAEWLYGAGRGCRHLAFLTAGTGMGAGFILDGRLFLGVGNAGEVGHLRLAPDGPWGHGKRGSFEGFCSGGGIGRWAQEWLRARNRSGGFGRAHVGEVTAQDVARAAGQGDEEAQKLLACAGQRLGEALAMLIDILNFERIVLGSVYVRSRQWLEPAMRRALAQEALPSSLSGCEILPSALGEQIGNYGAIAAAEYHRSTGSGAADTR